jgi:hypothetical protein
VVLPVRLVRSSQADKLDPDQLGPVPVQSKQYGAKSPGLHARAFSLFLNLLDRTKTRQGQGLVCHSQTSSAISNQPVRLYI